MSLSGRFRVLIVDVPEFSEPAESVFYTLAEAKNKVGGKDVIAHVYADVQTASELCGAMHVDAVLYRNVDADELENLIRNVQQKNTDGRRIPIVDISKNNNPALAPFVEEYKCYKDPKSSKKNEVASSDSESAKTDSDEEKMLLESTSAEVKIKQSKEKPSAPLNEFDAEEKELAELNDKINLLLSSCFVKANDCDNADARIATRNLVNKLARDFQEQCVSVGELKAIKGMAERVEGVLDANSALRNLKEKSASDESLTKAKTEIETKLGAIKEFSSSTYAKFNWGKNIQPLVAIFVGAVLTAVAITLGVMSMGSAIVPAAIIGAAGVGLMSAGMFAVRKNARDMSERAEKTAAFSKNIELTKNPS